MTSRLLIFLGVAGALLLYTLFLAGRTWPGRKLWPRLVAGAVGALGIGSQVAYRYGAFSLDSVLGRAISWAGGVALGLWGTFLLLSLPIELGLLVGWGVQKLLARRAFEASAPRRAFLRRAVPSGLAALSAGITALGVRQAVLGPKVKSVKVTIDGLPEELEGFTIAQISDLHVGPTIGREYVEDVATTVQSLEPMLIAITGDLADGSPAVLRERVEPLAALRAPLGVYYTTGNHEYYWGVEEWLQAARELGFTPLVNENRVLSFRDRKILLAGVTDTSGHQYGQSHRCDPRAAALVHEPVALKILLAHRPDTCLLEGSSEFQLQLSGHTHAGQFFPWRILMPLAHKYYRGLQKHGSTWVYVNSGTGYWGTPDRFTVPAEITLLTLSRQV